MQGDFVIQIRPDADLERGVFQGRIEHMDSSQSIHFRTVEELVAFIQRHLQTRDDRWSREGS